MPEQQEDSPFTTLRITVGNITEQGVACRQHRKNARPYYEGAFTSGGDVLYVCTMSKNTLRAMEPNLDRAKESGTKLRVLTWDPNIFVHIVESLMLHLREDSTLEDTMNQIRGAAEAWKELGRKYVANLRVRAYDTPPTMQGIIVCGRYALIEILTYATPTIERMALILTPQDTPENFKCFSRAFEKLWRHARLLN